MAEPQSSNAETEAELHDALVSQLAIVRHLLDAFRIRERHLPGDLTLAGLGTLAWDCANSLLLIVRDRRFTAGAYPVARLCFEVGVDALFLASSPDYDQAGAKARVFERLEYADLRTDLGAAFDITDFGSPSVEYGNAASVIENDALTWDRACPGKGDLLRAALAHFRPKFELARSGRRHPGHWSELSRRKMAAELEHRFSKPGLASRLIAGYASLSRSSHPRFHAETWQLSGRSDAPILELRPGRSKIALRMTEVGLDLLRQAYETVASTYG